jgi:Mlc titration factor MtfA (ptsG expression regulator)
MSSIWILVPIAGLVIYLILRKKPAKAPTSLNPEEKTILQEHVAFYQHLDAKQKLKFETKIGDFLNRIKVEGIGVDITAMDRLLIASSAVIPIFGFDGWQYRNLTNVVLYPDTFNKDFEFEGGARNILGMVGTGYMNGQMVLSRSALRAGFSANAGDENTGIHEFVHLLDKSDGATDGVPENLLKHEYTIPWLKMVHQEMHRIEAGKSDINPYAITNEAEFLAVVSEYFFEKPDKFKSKHPELYQILSEMFAQQPAIEKSL